MKFSRRADWTPAINRLTAAREKRGSAILDLTESNPTRAGIEYPLDELEEVIGRAARQRYDPDPRGIRFAREALGDPDNIILTASTSEAYSYLFKMLCDPGDNVVAAVPSYPLFEHLAGLETVQLRTFPLELHARWELHADRVREAIDERTRAVIVVNPNNPTGSNVTPAEQRALAAIGLPIISDEVFLEYSDGASFASSDALTFRLGGLSKSCGLPHYKLAWIRIDGPPQAVAEARSALELIADNYLSPSTPVQAALPDLLRIGGTIRDRIRERIARNLTALRSAALANRSVELLPNEGGWSAVLRVPRVWTDEEIALRLIEEHGVVVQPGYFFDFAGEGFLVLSLLTEPKTFDEGIGRLIGMIAT